MLRTLGELRLSAGTLERAAAHLRRALDRWTELSLPVFRARTLRDPARPHDLLGDRPTARALRTEALETFQLYGTREFAELRAAAAETEGAPEATTGR